ncbi:uncharacterized protein LOC116812763 isoform X2 [Hylobates moloch]|uniref:uncharacterized protein LOC116812763 isoform X2 n=1 Tax=Hylobates moloch TaxID=81572 RepID=UPI00267723F4|nr:uncharacterized protein LOC116812763 isoform X2 [Hylobates moloch]
MQRQVHELVLSLRLHHSSALPPNQLDRLRDVDVAVQPWGQARLRSPRSPAPPHLKCTTMGPVHLVPEAEDASGIGPDAVVRQAEVLEVLHRTPWLLLSGAGAPARSSPGPGPHPGCARAHGRTLGCRAALASPGNTCSEGSALHQPCRQHPGTPPLRPAETQEPAFLLLQHLEVMEPSAHSPGPFPEPEMATPTPSRVGGRVPRCQGKRLKAQPVSV